MRIFLSFGDSDLFFVCFFKDFAKSFCNIVFVVNYFYVLIRFIIIGQRNIIQIEFMHVLFVEIFLRKRFGKFTTSIGSEIKENNNIAFFNRSQWLAVFINSYNGIDKFISYTIFITFYDTFYDIF